MTLARYLYIPTRTHNFWSNSKTLYSSGFPKISTHTKGAKIATTKLGYFSCSTKGKLAYYFFAPEGELISESRISINL